MLMIAVIIGTVDVGMTLSVGASTLLCKLVQVSLDRALPARDIRKLIIMCRQNTVASLVTSLIIQSCYVPFEVTVAM